MNPQADFFRSVVACVDKAIKEPDLLGKIKSSMVDDPACGGDITITVRGKPLVEVNFMSQPFVHLGNAAANPLQIVSADSAVSRRDYSRRRLSPEDLVQDIFNFIRGELKQGDKRT